MIITLGQARQALAKYAGKSGKCADTEDVRLFVQEVTQDLLHRGAHGNLRKWCFCLTDGCFTAPPDMEVPLKVKIDGYPEHVWSKWYEFYDVQGSELSSADYLPGIVEQVNTFFTVYDIPSGGARVAAIPASNEADDAYIIVQGKDQYGKEVFTNQNGVSIHGERLPISRTTPKFSRTTFTQITGIEKSRTCNHVRLYWQTLDCTGENITDRGLLAEYRPTDIYPSFRRFRVDSASEDRCVQVTILGRVRLLDSYHDNDILPVSNLAALRAIAAQKQAEENKDIQAAQYYDLGAQAKIENENQYYRSNQDPFDFLFDTSPGSIENLQ